MNEKESAIACGYVPFGYFSPALTTQDTFPDYLRQEADRCVAENKSHQTENTVNFGFMTDIHYSETPNHHLRMQRATNIYRDIAWRTGTQMLVLGGDYINNGCKDYFVSNYRALRSFLSEFDYYPVNGNHDDNSFWDEWLEYAPAVNHLTPQELYPLFYDHLPGLGVHFDKKNSGLYYYKDDPVRKIRFVFMDSSDLALRFDENGKMITTKQHHAAHSQQQIDWLVNDALCFRESGWSVLLIVHETIAPGGRIFWQNEHVQVMNEIVRAYVSGEDVHQSWGEGAFHIQLDAPFSTCTRGELIGVLYGHEHKDLLSRDCNCTPYISRGNFIMYKTSQPRLDGDKSELLFDIVTIDTESKKLYFTRVGAGESLEVSYARSDE